MPPRKYAVAELTGALLDAAVLKALLASGAEVHTPGSPLPYSSSWQFGGPIIDTMDLAIHGEPGDYVVYVDPEINSGEICSHRASGEGPTLLVAAMRAFVAAKLGPEVDL